MDAAGHTGEAVARHVSPDGKLVWRVQRDVDPDGRTEYAAGFEGLLWHLHADQLRRSGEPLAKLLAVTDELLADRLVIIEETWPVPGQLGETGLRRWLLVDLELDIEQKGHDETWQLRFWSGRTMSIEDLIDGKVEFLPLDQKYFAE